MIRQSAAQMLPSIVSLQRPTFDTFRRHTTLFTVVLTILVVGFFSFLASYFLFPQFLNLIGSVLLWLQDGGGIFGPIVLVLLCILLSLPFVPGYSVLVVGSGFVYGWMLGFLICMLGTLLGAIAVFLVCRWYLSTRVELFVSTRPRMRAYIRALENDAFKIIFLLRLSPLPFGIINALCAVTSVSLTSYSLSSALSMFPEELVLAFFGSRMRSVTEVIAGKSSFDLVDIIFIILEVVSALVVTIVIGFAGKKAVADVEKAGEHGSVLKRSGSYEHLEEEMTMMDSLVDEEEGGGSRLLR
jgi:protein maelstrom